MCIRTGPWKSRRLATVALLLLNFLGTALYPRVTPAETIKIGVVKLPNPVFIALDRGYFDAEGIQAEPVFFDVATPIAAAVVSGALDVGATGLSAGFYSLAGQGALRIISGGSSQAPTFQSFAYVVSNHAYGAGLKSLRDLPGHSVAISQFGTPVHYSLALLAEKYKFDLSSLRVLPLQTNPNQVSAVIGGSADAAIVPGSYVLPAIERGDVKLLGWVDDETPWQQGAIFTATRTADEKTALVNRFLVAYCKAARDYHDAFTDKDGKRRNSADAASVLDILAKYTGQSSKSVDAGIQYYDASGRLDVADVLHQIAWYKAQGMLKNDVDGNQVIDLRYVLRLDRN